MNWIDRIAQSFASTRRAWKALPTPASLYQPSASRAATVGPIAFPGWDEWEKRQGQLALDDQRIKRAIQSPWVWSDIQAIANEASAADLLVKERSGDEWEDIDDHPLTKIWEAPNEHMGRSFVMSFWCWSYLLSGKAFLFWATNGADVQEVWPVPAHMLVPIPDPVQFIRGYAFKANKDAKPILIPPQYVTYSHSVNLFDIRDGLSFLNAAWIGIESDLAAADWNRNFFKESNGVPDGLITVPADTFDNDLDRIRLEIREFFGGTRRGVAVARAGDMDYKPFGRTQKDAEFLSGRAFSQKEVDRTLGFPEGYWSERSNRANAEQARDTMISGAVWPLLVRLAEDINAQQVRRWFDADVRAEFKDIRPEDRDMKLKEMDSRKTHWTVNELREADGKDPLDDPRGDMLIAEINKGMPIPATPASEATEAYVSEQEEAAGLPPGGAPPDATGAIPSDAPTDDTTAAPDAAPAGAGNATALPPAEVKSAELERWQRKALKAVRDGRSAAVKFDTDVVPVDQQLLIRQKLLSAADAAAVKAVFADAAAADDDELDDAVWQLAETWASTVLTDA